MKIQPFGERVTIKVIQDEEVTLGGLVTITSKEKSNKGIVTALGEEVKDYIKVGDTIVFNQGAGVSYTDGSDDYKVLNVRDILGRIIK